MYEFLKNNRLIVDFLANETHLIRKSKIYMWTQKICHNKV
jgi:hypothetical protein